jgi:transposase
LVKQRIGIFCDSLPVPICKVCGMAGKSSIWASDEQRAGLLALAGSRDRGEADRARAVLLTLAGWTSSKIAEAFGVREDTLRLWRSDFTAGGVAVLETSIAPGPPPVKSEAALRVAAPLLEEPLADRRNWTIPRLRAEIEARAGVRISRSQLSKALRKKVPLAAAPTHPEGTSVGKRGGTGGPATAQTAGRSGRHCSSLWQ